MDSDCAADVVPVSLNYQMSTRAMRRDKSDRHGQKSKYDGQQSGVSTTIFDVYVNLEQDRPRCQNCQSHVFDIC
jgi:hypothetical protein